MKFKRILWILGLITTVAVSTGEQWTFETQNQLCQEYNFILNCTCDNFNKVLNITSFQLLNIHSTIHSIIIQNCLQVFLGSNTLRNLQSLRKLEIVQVANLILSDSALNWTGYQWIEDVQFPSLHISIENTRVSKLGRYTFNGMPAEIKLHSSSFDHLEVFSFTSLSKLIQIDIKNSIFKKIDSQAFKGIQTKKIFIHNSTFGDIPSSAFRDLDITESIIISNSTFQTIKSQSFIIKQPKYFEISGSNFEIIEAEAFLVQAKGNIIMKHNNFANISNRAFMGISFDKESKVTPNEDFLFSDNKFNHFTKKWIMFNQTSFTPKYGAIIFNQTCSCTDLENWSINNEINEHIHCINDTIRQTIIHADKFRKIVCISDTETWVILVSVFISLLVSLIIAIIAIVFVYQRYKKQKQKVCVNHKQPKKNITGLIVPDGRTYRETEVHVIVEKTVLLTTEL